MTQAEIASKAKHVILYDCFFLLYIPIFFGSLGYNCYGISTLDQCTGTGPAWSASAMLIFFFWAASVYFVCWMCAKCCFAGANKVSTKVKTAAKSAVPAQVLGGKGPGAV